MPRHRIFKSELKKRATYKPSGTKNTKRTQDSEHKLGNIPFSEEMLTKEEVSNEYAKKTDVVDLVDTTWAELKALRDDGNLVPGRQYRITDYVATVANDPNARSANNPFDLIVVADSENKLNENARAIRHAGDTYFPESVKFEAWQVWYCLDNDVSRFAWADATNGKGVIYRLIDEWSNDCPYDFKGIQFARWNLSNPVGYIFNPSIGSWVEDEENRLNSVLELKYGLYGLQKMMVWWMFGYDYTISEFRFKIAYTVSKNPVYLFTFGAADYSVLGESVRENIIKPSLYDGIPQLNNIVFQNADEFAVCTLNTFGGNCSSNTFGSECSSNTFGDGCTNNTFGGYCSSNTFGDDYTNNTFGSYCNKNTLGDGFSANTFSDICFSNTFGSECSSNTFWPDCSSNTFGNACNSNTFGNACNSNSFGDNCNSNSFRDECAYNTFGDECAYNTFGENCNSNSFGQGCSFNEFGGSFYFNVFGDGCVFNTFGDDGGAVLWFVRYITFESGVNNIIIKYTGSESLSDESPYRNVTVAKGVENAIIPDSNSGQDYKTTYQAPGSQVIDVTQGE